jgi:phenylalanyl-tRNA synthetase alpha chain
MDILAAFAEFESSALTAIAAATDAAGIEKVRIEFLGQKNGRIRDLQKLVGSAASADKPAVGKRFNEVRTAVSEQLELRQQQLVAQATKAASDFDVTLPGDRPRLGRLHPITQVMAEFRELMGRFGFTVVDGPEIEDERHNFEALNIPEDHPARDPLDNFYIACASRCSRWAGAASQSDLHGTNTHYGKGRPSRTNRLSGTRLPSGHDRRDALVHVSSDGRPAG